MLGPSAFLGAVGVNAAVAIFLLVFFSVLRRHFPAVYSPRQHAKSQSHGLPRYFIVGRQFMKGAHVICFLFFKTRAIPSLICRCPVCSNSFSSRNPFPEQSPVRATQRRPSSRRGGRRRGLLRVADRGRANRRDERGRARAVWRRRGLFPHLYAHHVSPAAPGRRAVRVRAAARALSRRVALASGRRASARSRTRAGGGTACAHSNAHHANSNRVDWRYSWRRPRNHCGASISESASSDCIVQAGRCDETGPRKWWQGRQHAFATARTGSPRAHSPRGPLVVDHCNRDAEF